MSRYTFEFDKDLDQSLSELAEKKKITKADVLRRAIASYAYLNKQVDREKKVSITDIDDNVVKDVVLP